MFRFLYVPYRHTKEVLAECLMDCLFEWNLDRKLISLTMDNCTTNDAVVDILLDKLPFGSLILHGRLFHMRCCAHILNLIVQDGLTVIGERIERIRDSVAYWTSSPMRIQRFEESAHQMHISITKKLALDVKTRWNSTFIMLQTALLYKDVFTRLTYRDLHYKRCPTEEDWEVAQDNCEKLELFHRATELFSGTKYPTANAYFPTICGIRVEMTKWLNDPKDVVKNMALRMLEKFNKYWSVIHGIMGVATVLDPRYKLSMLEYYYKKIYGDNEALNEIMRIKNLCVELISEYEKQENNSNEPELFPPPPQSSIGSKCPLIDDLSDFDKFIQSKDIEKACGRSELEHYLEDGMMPRTPDFDILSFWKSSGPKYPLLQMIAKDIFAIPVSSVASESAFSTGGRVISPHRSKLLPTTVEALMCSQNWLWAEARGNESSFFYN
jgi:hypothetical protein